MDEKKFSVCFMPVHGVKWRLTKPYSHPTDLRPAQEISVRDGWVALHPDGHLDFSRGYAWDGPSGPTWDTPNWMRASLVHDGLYQLAREGALWSVPYREGVDEIDRRLYADRLMRSIAIEDGMSRLRAWYSYLAVRIFGSRAAAPSIPPGEICV